MVRKREGNERRDKEWQVGRQRKDERKEEKRERRCLPRSHGTTRQWWYCKDRAHTPLEPKKGVAVGVVPCEASPDPGGAGVLVFPRWWAGIRGCWLSSLS